MKDTFFIYMTQPDADRVQWAIGGKHRIKKINSGKLSQAAKAIGNRPVVLIIPGADVLLTETRIPSKNRQRLAKAIPYALEEFIIDDIASQHFALADKLSATSQAIAVISKKTLNNWLQVTKDAGIKLNSIIPDTLATPITPGWTIIANNSQSILRTGAFSGFSTDTNNLLQSLKSLLSDKDLPNPKNITLIATEDSLADQQTIVDWSTKNKIKIKSVNYTNQLVALFAKQFNPSQSINLTNGLLQSGKKSTGFIRKFYPALAACLIWLGFEFSSGFIRYLNMDSEYQQLKKESIVLFKQSFPNAKKFSNVKKRMQATLRTFDKKHSGHQFGFIELLGASGHIIKNIESMKVANLHFQNGELNIRFTIDDTGKIDTIENQLKKLGLSITRGASDKNDNGYSSQMTISGKKS